MVNVAAKHVLMSEVQTVDRFCACSATTSIVQFSQLCSALSRMVSTVKGVRPERLTSMRRRDASMDEFSANSIQSVIFAHVTSVVALHGVATYSRNPQGVHGMESRRMQKWLSGHGVGADDPFMQIVPSGHGVGAVDPAVQDARGGHCSAVVVLRQKKPAGHGSAIMVPGRHSCDWLHASISDGVAHWNPSGHGNWAVVPSGQKNVGSHGVETFGDSHMVPVGHGLGSMVPSGQNDGRTHSVCSDGELQNDPEGHSVSLLEPGAQKWPIVQLVGEIDPSSHHEPSGQVWFSNGVGHMNPALQSCC